MAMFSPAPGDVLLRGLIDGRFTVVDAIQKDRVAGPIPLQAALAYAYEHGATSIFQQPIDGRGRIMGKPLRFTR